MLALFPILIIGGFLGGCVVVITASCCQLVRISVNTPRSGRQIPRAIHA